ncbi:MAG: glycosyltransferase [Chloroflexi bacterium]|nr:glycosyltransferase [Chloroflexota bacterium]
MESKSVAIIAGQLVIGGAEHQLYLWLSNLDRKRFSPVVITLHPGYNDYWEKEIETLEIPIIYIEHRRFPIMRLLDIISALRPYKPKLIHGWHTFASPYAGLVAKFLGAKSLGGLRDSYRIFWQNSALAYLTLWLTDFLLVNSNSASDNLHDLSGISREKMYVVQNAVEQKIENTRLKVREELNRSFGLSLEKIWIGSLGRLVPKKRYDLLLEIIALLYKEFNEFHFLIIGDGPERSRLERLAVALGISDILTFVGEIPEASYLLKALDIFCFASLDEGLPNVIMEAAIAGVPVVTWRLPYIVELLEPDSEALLIEPRSLCEFKDTLTTLVQFEEVRKKIGNAGRDRMLKDFSVDRYVKNMTKVYEDLLDY